MLAGRARALTNGVSEVTKIEETLAAADKLARNANARKITQKVQHFVFVISLLLRMPPRPRQTLMQERITSTACGLGSVLCSYVDTLCLRARISASSAFNLLHTFVLPGTRLRPCCAMLMMTRRWCARLNLFRVHNITAVTTAVAATERHPDNARPARREERSGFGCPQRRRLFGCGWATHG